MTGREVAEPTQVVGRRIRTPDLFHPCDVMTTPSGSVFVNRRAYTVEQFELICHGWLAWYEDVKLQRGPGG